MSDLCCVIRLLRDPECLLQAFSSRSCTPQHLSRRGRQKRHTEQCQAAANTGASARKGNELLFAAVETLFKVPPLFNMAVRQVRAFIQFRQNLACTVSCLILAYQRQRLK